MNGCDLQRLRKIITKWKTWWNWPNFSTFAIWRISFNTLKLILVVWGLQRCVFVRMHLGAVEKQFGNFQAAWCMLYVRIFCSTGSTVCIFANCFEVEHCTFKNYKKTTCSLEYIDLRNPGVSPLLTWRM